MQKRRIEYINILQEQESCKIETFTEMSTLDAIVKDYDKNIVLRDCQRQAFEYLHTKLSHKTKDICKKDE
jgi:hypothetical protein